MTSISVVDYRSTPDLDTDLANLACAAVHGWPDQRPITAAGVRSWMRPMNLTATTLALHRDDDGRLDAAAAVRWPVTPEATAHLWGPLVHPSARGGGLGSTLLSALVEVVAARPGVRVTTVEIPETRKEGWAFYERAGWHGSGTARLLKRPLTAVGDPHASVPVRTVRVGEYIAPALADLYAAVRPDEGYPTARDIYSRWTADARYTPDGLLLAEGPAGLQGAALVLPLRAEGDQPAEAELVDLIISPRLDADAAAAVQAALVSAFLHAGATMGATVARAVVRDADLARALSAMGFQVADDVRYYARPAA